MHPPNSFKIQKKKALTLNNILCVFHEYVGHTDMIIYLISYVRSKIKIIGIFSYPNYLCLSTDMHICRMIQSIQQHCPYMKYTVILLETLLWQLNN